MTTFRLAKQTPEINNEIYSLYYAYDQRQRIYYAKIFSISKLQHYGLDQCLEYNEQVLSDMQGIVFPQHINKIMRSIPNDGYFTFISEPYETNLQQYMHRTCINQIEAIRIFDHVLKAVYSIYSNGYWHKNIRPEHFVKIGNTWKLDSLVFSEYTNNQNSIQSQYVWNRSYQPPEAYQNNIQNFSDEDFLPMVVWNLGSLLLDLFFSVHKLKSYDIIKSYKGKKFNLELIKVKRTDIFSKKLRDILCSMLHYEPKSRMKLQQVFSNEYLSKQVSSVFKKKHKHSIMGAIKIFTGGRSALSSALLSKQERDKGSKILPISQLVKEKIQNIGHNKVKSKAIKQVQSLNEVDTDEGFFDKISIFSQFLRKKQNSQIQSKRKTNQLATIQDLMTNKQFESIIRIYKSNLDKSDLLTITGDKIIQIDYKNNKKQIILLSKYALQLNSYLNIKKVKQTLLNGKNTFGDIDLKLLNKFNKSEQYNALKQILNAIQKSKQIKLTSIKTDINSLQQSEIKILSDSEIRRFTLIDYRQLQFLQIKVCYRKILKISYDFVTKQYNTQCNDQKIARLAMYIVYSLTIDKLYLQNMIEKNFSFYFQWSKQKPTKYVSLNNFRKYIQQASVNTLILHAKSILETYFKL